MSEGRASGVVVAPGPDGRRSTTRLGREVVAAALTEVDPVGARSANEERSWRAGYVPHVRRLVEAGLLSADAAGSVATRGLAALADQLRYASVDGAEDDLAAALATTVGAAEVPGAETVVGQAQPERELSLPLHGRRLRGAELHAQLSYWTDNGVLEPSCAQRVRQVAEHPEWLALDGWRVVVVGAGSEMGPLRALLRWGADVVGVDLPQPGVWEQLLQVARGSAGRLTVPAREGSQDLAHRAGLDLLTDLPAVAAWVSSLRGRLAVGSYVYADGALNLRVCAAADALGEHVRAGRPETALAFLATPTDVFAVPGEAVAHAVRAYEQRSTRSRLLGRPLRTLSGGRLLQRSYQPGADPGVNDSLVPQQGPNYALAKRLQRWRATVAREQGALVSFHVAPPTRTRSVLKNRALAAAYAGAHRFGVEVFEPATANTLMAALLVADLQDPRPPAAHPWQDEADAAAHGGLWRCPYAPRSALGLAAVLGMGGARG